eukprot:CAMPEP_0115083300 /NCGR_PEP_ID=MMETSP0227-20121206/20451_1 /TAXON_ID=89957 /ORGANISM="Polarella glacialis, Strain CCMP 1383" /LENGTH=32 /DNA_ID= /DNA_START= /DNA_END= /DNA_ORIENTATION=
MTTRDPGPAAKALAQLRRSAPWKQLPAASHPP